MKKYKLVIFDLDGTIADTSEGIYNAHRYTITAMGMQLDEKKLEGVIGGELFRIYKDRFGFEDREARKAVDIYRKWYQEYGIYQVKLYTGISNVLNKLKDAGIILAVATLKRQDFARKMLKDMGVGETFDFIFGMDDKDTLNKEKLLKKCIKEAQVHLDEAVLVGDSINDSNGAKACGIDFIGVTYGFGFCSPKEVKSVNSVFCVEKESELEDFLLR